MNHLQLQVSVGTIAVTWNSHGLLTRIDWYDTLASQGGQCGWFAISRVGIPSVLADLIERLRLYFDSGTPLGPIPWDSIDRSQWSEFQERVYRAITEIPHGETRNYSWAAKRVGQVAAARAVGQALRKNPLPILIPCHRVVSANALGGFMGIVDPDQPELLLKKRLIDLENGYINPMFPFLTGGSLGAPDLLGAAG